MLEPAIKYKDQLEKIQYELWFNDKYKYWNCGCYYDTITIEDSTWNKHQFVSVLNGEVLGYISYGISRQNDRIDSLSIINFSDNKFVFAKDLHQALKDIFEKYKFRKMTFSVVIGNPIEESYDKMIAKCGGRIIGIYKEDVKLADGEYYDLKTYEILASEYFNAVKKG